MSEFHVEVVRLGPIEKHPNADTLGITKIHGGYPVIVKLGQYIEGQLAIYVPVDSVVPKDDPRWEFLKGHARIKAKKLRGVFSMGLLTEAPDGSSLGTDMADALRILKYEPPPPAAGQEDDTEPPPGIAPVYTDIEGLRRYPDLLQPGEPVIITEKLHGENMRAVKVDGVLHVGSRTRWKKRGAGGWWRAAEHSALEARLGSGVVIYGEAHGYIGGFPYGTTRAARFRAFDAFDANEGRYLDFDAFAALCSRSEIERVPLLYRGPWDPKLAALAEGTSELDDSHVREGIVIRLERERFDDRIGRVVLKLHGEGFLLKS
jgi:RNA ligase (TIGR02306 family)